MCHAAAMVSGSRASDGAPGANASSGTPGPGGSRVALVQLRVDDTEPVADRVDRVAEFLVELRGAPDLVLLPELWPVGAFNLERILAHAEPLDGPFCAVMSGVARQLGTTLHAGSFAEKHDGGVSNTSVVFGPDGSRLAAYRKIHLFGFDSGEAVTLTAGTDQVLVDTALGSTGLTTCYDLRFPELYRNLTAAGGEAFLVPAGWPATRIEHWDVLARARAIENQSVLLACNAVGTNGGVRMGGRSVAVTADGTVLARAAATDEQVLWVELDLGDTAAWRETFPALRDRRLS